MFGFFKKKTEERRYKLTDIPNKDLNIASSRGGVDIAVIDDRDFSYASKLRNSGFRLDEVGDIDNIKKIEAYPLIICDIQGVGSAFGADSEGAFVISEIRDRYPDKYIIAYSTDPFSHQDFINKADKAVLKVTSVEQWVSVLNEGVSILLNPKSRWIRVREKLLSSNVDIYDVFLLEQAYIKSILEKDKDILSKKSTELNIDSFAKEVISIFVKVSLGVIIKQIWGAHG